MASPSIETFSVTSYSVTHVLSLIEKWSDECGMFESPVHALLTEGHLRNHVTQEGDWWTFRSHPAGGSVVVVRVHVEFDADYDGDRFVDRSSVHEMRVTTEDAPEVGAIA